MISSHLFLTLAILSEASCLASFSLSSLSFLVQARIALIDQIQCLRLVSGRALNLSERNNVLLFVISIHGVFSHKHQQKLSKRDKTDQSSWLHAPKNCLNMLFSWKCH